MTTTSGINASLQKFLDAFESQAQGSLGAPVATSLEQQISSFIAASPALLKSLDNDSINGTINSIQYKANGSGAYFDPNGGQNSIVLTQQDLSILADSGNSAGFENNIIFTLAHEDQHADYAAAQNAPGMQTTDAQTLQAVKLALANSSNPDLTSILQQNLTAHLQDEAQADIAGWNAVVSAAAAASPTGTLTQADINLLILNTQLAGGLFPNLSPSLQKGMVGGTVSTGGLIPATQGNIATYANFYGNFQTSTNELTYNQLYDASILNQVFSQNSSVNSLTFSFGALGLASSSPGTDITADVALLQNGFNCGKLASCQITNSDNGDVNSFSIKMDSNGNPISAVVVSENENAFSVGTYTYGAASNSSPSPSFDVNIPDNLTQSGGVSFSRLLKKSVAQLTWA